MKQIKLASGQFALVDDEDFEYLDQYKWQANANDSLSRAFVQREKNKKTVFMHNYIISTKPDEFVEHLNKNQLDCQKKNLRVTPIKRRGAIKAISKNNTSGYKGVHWDKDRCQWRAKIGIGSNRRIHLGMFKTVEEAAVAYNNAARKYFGEFAKLNNI